MSRAWGLIDFGVHVDFETSHYFLVSLMIEPISEEGPIRFLAEFFDGDLHMSGPGDRTVHLQLESAAIR